MTFNLKRTLTLILMFFLFLGVSHAFTAQTLHQDIFSPYNFTIDVQTKPLNTNDINNPVVFTETHIGKPARSQSYVSAQFPHPQALVPSFSMNCVQGGSYNMNVYFQPQGASLYNVTEMIYYCNTLGDLIKTGKMPSSWSSDELILYCNDGQNIFSQVHNFDFIIKQLGVYKACILKNLDTSETMLFGYDVGDKIFDHDYVNFFNFTTNIGGLIFEPKFTYNSASSFNRVETRDIYKSSKIKVPFQCLESNTYDDGEGTSYTTCTRYGPQDHVCLSQNSCSPWDYECTSVCTSYGSAADITTTPAAAYINSKLSYRTLDQTSFRKVADYGSGATGYSIFSYDYLYLADAKLGDFEYQYNSSNILRNLYFSYDEANSYFVLRDFSDSLDSNITDSLPGDFGLSRVFLLKKKDGQDFVYGYESAMKIQYPTVNSILPVYKIQFEAVPPKFNDFCRDMLVYVDDSIGNTLSDENDLVACGNGGQIIINSQGIDGSNYGKVGDAVATGSANSFRLFQNILLGLKN